MVKKLVDPDRLCMGCMCELDNPQERCPHCGFEANKYIKPKNSLPLKDIVNGKYLIGRVIGSGGFSITYIGWDFYQGKKVCIKEYFPKQVAVRNQNPRNYTEEITVLISCTLTGTNQTISPERAKFAYIEGLKTYIEEAKNLAKFFFEPGIVSVRDYFYGNNTAYIVMEYIDGMDMKHFAKLWNGRVPPDRVLLMLKPALKSLEKVHKAGIIHRDISPDNIMISYEGKVKLIDFGAAKDFCNAENAQILLKHGYAPIEQYYKNGPQGPWTDVYSMCATIYYLLTGIRIPKVMDRMKQDTVQPLQVMGVPVSEEFDMAILKGLRIYPKDRFQSIGELYECLYGEPIQEGANRP